MGTPHDRGGGQILGLLLEILCWQTVVSRFFYDYTNKYEENNNKYLELEEEYSKFKKVVGAFQQRPICRGQPIQFLLSEPNQRLPR